MQGNEVLEQLLHFQMSVYFFRLPNTELHLKFDVDCFWAFFTDKANKPQKKHDSLIMKFQSKHAN